MPKPSVLLAYGEKEFSRGLKKALEERNYTVVTLSSGPPPKASYDFILQLAQDPTDLTEGTRRLLEKMVKDRARFFLLAFRSEEKLYQEALRFAESLTRDFERKFGISTNILRLGRLYGPGVPEKDSGAVGFLIREFAEGRALTLYGEGKEVDYYLFVDDAFDGISEALAGAKVGITYAIAPTAATSAAGVAKLLLELGGERHETRYHHGLVAGQEQGPVEGEPTPGWRGKTSISEGILAVLKTRPATAAKKTLLWTAPNFKFPTIALPQISFKKPPPLIGKIALAILILLSPFIYLGAETAFAFYQLNRTKETFLKFDFDAASSSANLAAGSFSRLARWERLIPPLGAAAIGKEISHATADLSANGSSILGILENLLLSRQGLPTEPQSEEQFRALAADLSSAEDHLSLARVEVDQLAPLFPTDFVQTLKGNLEDSLIAVRLGRAFSQQAYSLLGYEGERHYLILFENSTELRSTGGYLGSLAQLTLENGEIKKLEFFDSYQFDSASKTPLPAAFKHFFKQESTLLREANVAPSFPQAAKEVARIFGNDQGVQVHGAFAATLIFAQDILSATGSLELAEIGKTVTAENLFALATEEVEKDFFPGSTKKKRFMQALGEGLVEKLFSVERQKYARIAEAVWEGLNQKNLLLYFQSGQLAQALLETGFDGRIKAASEDYLAVLDNNYSAKVNGVFVKRALKYRVYSPDKEGQLRGDLTVTWNHTGTDAWPSSSYYNLLLVLAPKGSVFLGAKLNGNAYHDTFVGEEEGKTALAAYFYIPHSAVTTFEFIYALPEKFDLDTLKNYQLTVQKQPGTQGESFSFAFEKTFGTAPSGDLLFDGKLDQDLDFEIQLEKE